MSNAPKFKLPPGPSFIISQILSWKTPGYISFVTLLRVGAGAVGVHVPVWAIVASSAVALPAVLRVQSELRDWWSKRAAAALGARLAPKITGKKPFGIDLITASLEDHKTGYIGEH